MRRPEESLTVPRIAPVEASCAEAERVNRKKMSEPTHRQRGIGRHLHKMEVSPDSTGDSFCITSHASRSLCAASISFGIGTETGIVRTIQTPTLLRCGLDPHAGQKCVYCLESFDL